MFFGLVTYSWHPISFYSSVFPLGKTYILCPTAYAFRFRFVSPASRSIFPLLHTFVAGNIVDSRAMAILILPLSSSLSHLPIL